MYSKWDIRYLQFAHHVASWSKDPSTKAGAVIVKPNRSVLSVGFNGFPQNMPDNQEWYDNRDEKYSRIVHCEVNALIMAEGSARGCTLYTWPFACCDRCVVQMLQAGINRFVFPTTPERLRERWQPILDKTKKYLEECSYVQSVEIPYELVPPVLIESFEGQYEDSKPFDASCNIH